MDVSRLRRNALSSIVLGEGYGEHLELAERHPTVIKFASVVDVS